VQLLVILIGIPIAVTKYKYCRDWGVILKYALRKEGAKGENDLTQLIVGTSGWAL
jgi:hypothetical protein